MRRLRLIEPPKVDCGSCRFAPLCIFRHTLVQIMSDNAAAFYQGAEEDDPLIIQEITVSSCGLYAEA